MMKHIMTTKHRQHIIRNTSALLFGLIGIGATFLLHTLIARHYGAADYGDFSVVLAMSLLVASLLLLGVNYSVGKFLPDYISHKKTPLAHGFVTLSLRTIALTGSCVFLAGCTIALVTLMMKHAHNPKVNELHLYFYCIWLGAIEALFYYLVRFNRALHQYFIAGLHLAFIRYTLTLIFLYILVQCLPEFDSIFYVVIAYTFAVILSSASLFVFAYSRRTAYISKTADFDIRTWRTTSFQMLASNLFAILHNALVLVYVEIVFHNEHITGFFAATLFISGVYWALLSSVQANTVPLLNDKELSTHQQSYYNLNVAFSLGFALILSLLIFFFSHAILSWFGPDFSGISSWLYVLAASKLISAPLFNAYSFLDYKGFQKQQLLLTSISLVILIIIMPVLINTIGDIGAIISLAIMEIFLSVVSAIMLKIRLGIKPLILF